MECSMRVREMMSRPVVTVSTSTSIADAARVMITHGFTALPVLDGDDRLVGIVTEAAQMMVDERIRSLPIVDGHGIVGILTRRDVLRAAIADNDQDLADKVTRQLAALDNPDRWQVSVHAGVADIEDFGTDTRERAQASRLAAAVPGVVQVQARHQTPDPF